jgi:type I restriction enzyme R subunit
VRHRHQLQARPRRHQGEESGEGETEKLHQYAIYRKMLADYFNEPKDRAMHRVEEFEKLVKDRFKKEPGQMRLLIVVDKLLTGFDAPSATYLYIDKKMQDHGLFQAICRVNRLDGDDKEYGYIVDYKDLFKSLEGAITDYTSGAFEKFDEEDVAGLLSDRIEKGGERLEEMREQVKAICEPVLRPAVPASTCTTSAPKTPPTKKPWPPTNPNALPSTKPSGACCGPTPTWPTR